MGELQFVDDGDKLGNNSTKTCPEGQGSGNSDSKVEFIYSEPNDTMGNADTSNHQKDPTDHSTGSTNQVIFADDNKE